MRTKLQIMERLYQIERLMSVAEASDSAIKKMERQHPWLALLRASQLARSEASELLHDLLELLEADGWSNVIMEDAP